MQVLHKGRGRRLMAVGLALAATLFAASCAQPGSGAPPTVSAGDLLALWEKALSGGPTPPLIVTSQLQGQVGSWSNAEGGHHKLAVLSGRVTAGSGVSATAQKDVTIRVAGAARTVHVMSAAAALHALAAAGSPENSCVGDCSPVVLEAAALIMQKASTAAGPVTVPTWTFGVRGSKVRLTWMAIDPTSMPKPPALPDSTMAVSGDRYPAGRVVDGSDLELVFIGSPPGPGPCGAEYTADAKVSSRVVAITIADVAPTQPIPAGTACALIGAMRTVSVHLGAPLGNRILIDGKSGQVITVTS